VFVQAPWPNACLLALPTLVSRSCCFIDQRQERGWPSSRRANDVDDVMVTTIARSLKDWRGIETLEWILVGAFLTGFVVTAYGTGIVPAALNTVVTAIQTQQLLAAAS
jgi:hypothetical protein